MNKKTINQSYIKTKLNLAIKLAKKASKIILSHYGKITPSFKDTINNLVTKADYESENLIINEILKKYPNDLILSEETQNNVSINSKNLWIIDPLDGTNNFCNNIPQFCISIAYAEYGEVLIGVIYDPIKKELFHAIKGHGAFLNNKKIKTSNTKNINKAIVASGFYYDRGIIMKKTLKAINKLFQNKISGFRRMGSAALDLCWLSMGRYDAYFEYFLNTWDFAAGILIVKEANGKCYDRVGQKLKLDSHGIIATNRHLNSKIIKIVNYEGQ